MKRLEKLLKKFLSAFVTHLLPDYSKQFQNKNWREFKRVLVFRLDNRLGNAILLLPLIQSIKQSLPGIKADVLMSSYYGEIYHNHPAINEYISYDQIKLLHRPWLFLQLIRYLRRNAYDAVFSSGNPNSFSISQAIFARLISKGFTVGFDWKSSEEFYSHVVPGNVNIHYAESQVDLWRCFDQQAKYEPPRVYFAANDWTGNAIGILFWLGATGNKVLPANLVEKLFQVLQNSGIKVDFACGPHDEKIVKKYAPEIRNDIQIRRGSLIDTARFFSGYKILIMPDTGPLHLAIALGIPVVQIFVKSNITWYAYKGDSMCTIKDETEISSALGFINAKLGSGKFPADSAATYHISIPPEGRKGKREIV